MQIYIPFIACEVINFSNQKQLCYQTCAVREEIFKTITRMSTIKSRKLENKAMNHVKSTPKKNLMKVLFHYTPTLPSLWFYYSKSIPKSFSYWKNIMAWKQKERGGEKSNCCVNSQPENHLQILLSVYAWTSEADKMYLL